MKVIEMDGKAGYVNRDEIISAIEKANEGLQSTDRVSKAEISEVISCLENTDKKRILVEDIPEMIGQKLMEIQKIELAKKYALLS